MENHEASREIERAGFDAFAEIVNPNMASAANFL